MQRRVLLASVALVCACDPNIPKEEPTAVVTARFDPSAAVPVVPTPNDLATNPATGLNAVTPPAGSSGADLAFYAYLNSLNGFPNSATAAATFDGDLQSDSVSGMSVKVYDITNGLSDVAEPVIGYVDTDNGAVKGTVTVGPKAGTTWIDGHSYAVALVAGPSGLKGAGGAAVKGSATWSFIRASKSLVTCSDLSSPDCKTATEIIPSPEKNDPAKRLANQTASAIRLEGLRIKYKPVIDKVIAGGTAREDIVLAWTFKIADFTQVVFDPAASKIPTPNDLLISRTTGLVTIPPNAAYSAAYTEFINDYLNTLDGFPVTSTANIAVSRDVDPATVTNDSVLVLPLDGSTLSGPPNVRWNSTTKSIEVAPPGGTWGKGHQFGVVVLGRRGIDSGDPDAPPAVAGADDAPVVASSVWALVRSASPLVDCADLTAATCTAENQAIKAAPLTFAQAVQLEQLRRIYAPLLAAVEDAGHDRLEVALAFTFKTVSLPEMTFDPSASIIPFPNNVLRGGMPARLTLPVPDGGSALQTNLVLGLNTLDGFSLTAPIVSESSETRAALDQGNLDPDTLDAGVGFLRLGAGVQPQVTACLNCASSLLPDGGPFAGPEQLQIVPRIPLEEQSLYGAYVTTGVKDLDGHRVIPAGAFALVRLQNPLCDTTTMKTTVPVLSDVQACGAGGSPGLEALRAGLKPFIDTLVTAGRTRKEIALAWAFTTESTVSELKNLADATATPGLLPTTVSLQQVGTSAVPATITAIYGAIPSSNIGGVFIGTMTLPFALTGPGQTITPPNNWAPRKAAYMLTIPTGAAPTGGWPIVIFGHGLTSNRTTMLPITNALASAGFATVGVDVVWHGERTTCTGAGTALAASIPNATDDYACASPTNNSGAAPDPMNAQCNQATGRCIARPTGNITPLACTSDTTCMVANQGYCLGTGFCEGADFWRNAQKQPIVNAWNFLNLGNLFAARDNFRHYAIDLAQVVRIIKADGFAAQAGGPSLDDTNINYVGQSLGGFNGTLFSATNTDAKNVMLNVPGSDQTQVLLTSPAFAPQRTGFLAQLAPLGLTPGTAGFDQLMVLIRTIFDRADPQNFILTSVNINMPTTRKVFIQSIEGDTVVPNATTDKLINAARSGAKQPYLERVVPPMSLPATARHSFLLNFTDPATTAAAQAKAVTFISTGVVP